MVERNAHHIINSVSDYDLSIRVLFLHQSHVALDRNLEPGYNALLLQLIPGDLSSACPDRQFYILPGL